MTQILYDFGTGRSDPSTFPTAALQTAATEAIAEEAEYLTEYPGGLGHPGLRRIMAARESEREGVEIDPDHLILTNGSMQAVTLSAQALQKAHGDGVIVEEYSYPGTLSAYRGIKYKMHGVQLDEGGMRMDHLRDTLLKLDKAGERPKFIYAISTYQNPTGFVMPKSRRLEMIQIAREFELPIVEDNCYADVHYEGEIEPALFALDPNPNHLYLGSLSKILAPGFRLGYILARPPMLQQMLRHRHDAGSNSLAAAIAAKFYANGIGAHAATSNAVLKDKRDLLLDGLAAELTDICTWSKPVGGLFVWLRLPNDIDLDALNAESAKRGVKFLPGSAFHYQNKSVPFVRLAFGHLTPDQITVGAKEFALAVRSSRTSNEAVGFNSLFD